MSGRTREEDLAAVAAIAETDPASVKGYALLTDTGTGTIGVHTDQPLPDLVAALMHTVELITGREFDL